MSKKAFFSIIFFIISLGICLLIANEYLKRVEIKAINRYLHTLQNETKSHSINLTFSPVVCFGFIKHHCKSDRIELDSSNFEGKNVVLKDTSLSIVRLDNKQIAVQIKIGEISQNLIFLPKNFAYEIGLEKQDSALGYIMLNHLLDFNIGNITGKVNLAILVRDKRFKNKNILFLLKEWFDTDTPSFYEYSLDSLNITLEARGSVDSAFFKANEENLNNLLSRLNFHNPHFTNFLSAMQKLMKNEIKSIDFTARRKNANLIFFNTLSTQATKKKASEIGEILDSIDESYAVHLKTQ